ncbi:adenosine receptor A1-like isoform X2 [Thunnus albacares]|uniref:adenosine receptor A1-like isoform X2 n=1 Tax=Thunnus maccoyii TaxID=8240 RepID=UPI001C4D34A1|nr:adenosine receptor A1-like isoform X2 [Thunnus maccoyii]XP_044207591.1 adenosine receptor A1-like isoform X2 [Thunnus albacares]
MAEWSWVAYTVLEVLIAAACSLGNTLVVCAVCVGIRDSLREPTFCFLVSLAVADFLVGVAAVPLAVLLDGWVNLTPDLCLFLSCVVLVLTQASVLSLLAIAVDRYLRLHTPHRYKAMATQKRTCLAVSVCWILSCLLGFTPLFGWHNYSTLPSDSTNTSSSSFISPSCTFLSVISLPFMVYFNFLGCVMAPLLVMTLLYMRIFWSLQGRLKDSSPQAQASLLRERRLACSLALVLILFASCWIPLHLMNCLLLFHGPQAVTQGTLYTGILLSHANSAVNPVVYAYRIPKIQQAYSQIWSRFLMRLNSCHGDKQVRRSSTGHRTNHTETCGSGGRATP